MEVMVGSESGNPLQHRCAGDAAKEKKIEDA
jgi:hypothetical protein